MIQFEPSLQDLNLLGLHQETFVRALTRQCVIATAGVSMAMLVGCMAIGVSSLPWIVTTVLVVPFAAWSMSVGRLRKSASRARIEMDMTVAVFLDLVNVLVAGGAGIETAMLAAAAAGDGRSFQRIRLALATAQGTRSSYWDTLRTLGTEAGVVSLVDVAHSVQLAGEQGARIRLTLAAKAKALRSSNLARIEHDAEERTELMGLPIVLMFLGFVLLIGYPAFVSTIGAL